MQVMDLDQIAKTREQLLRHPVYESIDSLPKLQIYMQSHVFAVWDFMSLLKRLQQDVTCVKVPWTPSGNAKYARFINEIVLGEESDEDGLGAYASHFELYVSAMKECGAQTQGIFNFIEDVRRGVDPLESLKQNGVPEFVHHFVAHTLDVARNGQTHEVCAAFFYGREDIIPGMFQKIVDELSGSLQISRFMYYLNRHIEVDSDQHGPLAQQLLADLCAGDAKKLQEAHQAAQQALAARMALWDGVLESMSVTR
ncbi:mangotoxin biosynthesis-involved protein MgoB [Sulfoacidibacillus thermotolerans]|uniref:Mangotoxin biosynthesis-involved protein MgoB n=2 Tax=Sulfoacidibacillus thermotolerans TaxID=1765684 RepID=A0A2U3D7M5_SULT2|nr:mangotoxin biosynthesis-involved protein MgoB [Sulfoacidibacillus thermotolerans]